MAKHRDWGNTAAQRALRHTARALLTLGAGLIALTLGWPALSRTMQIDGTGPDAAQSCLSAATDAALAEDVPLDVLVTIALVESGRDRGAGLAPWPWAIHTQGRGHWPDHRADALRLAQAALDAGVTNIDLGCFQINYRWHSAEFDDLAAMLDPVANARYAAKLLRRHFDRLGSWDAAVGAYHSKTPDLAATYRARFAKLAGHAPGLTTVSQPTTAALHPTQPATAGAIALQFAAHARPLVDMTGARP